MNILIVEDDRQYAALIEQDLRMAGHSAAIAPNGQHALKFVAEGRYDGILLDCMMPVVDGMSVIRSLREGNISTPVIMLTALDDLQHRIDGLNGGVDDYLVKPVDAAELVARFHAIMRRQTRDGPPILQVGDIELNLVKHSVSRAGRRLELGTIERKILTELMQNADQAVTRSMLYKAIWGTDFHTTSNLIESHVRRLRIALNDHGRLPDPIVTIRGVGYCICETA